MHLDVNEWISFKFGMVIGTFVLYILMLVKSTLTLIQGHRSVKTQKLLHRFEWNLVYYWDLLMNLLLTAHSIFEGENTTYMILFKKIL